MVRAHVHRPSGRSDRALVASKPRRRGEFESPVGSATSHRPVAPSILSSNGEGSESPIVAAKLRIAVTFILSAGSSSVRIATGHHKVRDPRYRESTKGPNFIPPVPTAAPVPAAPVSERPPGKRRGEDVFDTASIPSLTTLRGQAPVAAGVSCPSRMD